MFIEPQCIVGKIYIFVKFKYLCRGLLVLFTVGVLGQEEAVLYEYEDYDFECPDEYLGYFPHLFRYGQLLQEVER